MYNSIILSASLFGSVYLFSKSLQLINKSFLENRKIPQEVFLINGVTFVASSSIFYYIIRFQIQITNRNV
jgi:hypothetical protein